MAIILYKITAERTQTVIRSHDPRFLYSLADLLDGNPTDSVILEQMKAFARDIQDVLNGKVAGHTGKERVIMAHRSPFPSSSTERITPLKTLARICALLAQEKGTIPCQQQAQRKRKSLHQKAKAKCR